METKEEPSEQPVLKTAPLYDPYTGEPNLDYEKLTGGKNPFLNKLPLPYEPKRKNRWLVTFPEHFKIPQWCVSKTERPSLKIVPKKFLGITYERMIEWGCIKFEFNDPIGPSMSESLDNLIENHLYEKFDYTLEMLDPTGVSVEKWNITGCTIKAIDLGHLAYDDDDDDDGIAKCYMTIIPSDATLA